jgi:hypothetical protein
MFDLKCYLQLLKADTKIRCNHDSLPHHKPESGELIQSYNNCQKSLRRIQLRPTINHSGREHQPHCLSILKSDKKAFNPFVEYLRCQKPKRKKH